MNPMLRREIILKNCQESVNRGLVEEAGYELVNTNNESCIDNLDIQYKIVDGKIMDIRFDGEACSISTSATSIMIQTLVGKTVKEAEKIVENYEHMIEEKPYDVELLGDLQVYEEIYKQPNRKRCALLPFETFHKVISKEEKCDEE